MTTKITEKNISSLSNFGVDWQAVIVADGSTATSVEAGKGYFIDTTSNAHTVTLPSSPNAGDTIAIKDYAGTFASNNLTIGRNGHNIQGVANDSLISTNRASLLLVYVDSTKGWLFTDEHNVADLQAANFTAATGGTVTESGDFKIHSFTGDGCFVVSTAGNSPVVPAGGPGNVDYLVVAGGGSGGSQSGQGGTGGGGAGGYRTTFPSPGCNAGAFPIAVQTYPITVGGGGSTAGNGTNGSNSVFSTITSAGGGYGGIYPSASSVGGPGGSGGGGGARENGGPGAGGSGNTPPTSPSQGNSGGSTSSTDPGNNSSSGGGGAAGGGSAGGTNGGNAGAGSPNTITGSNVSYAGGGGGGTRFGPTAGSGGAGGGGAGATGCGNSGTAGTVNTGGGGGGSGRGSADGGVGGSGIVIIRYKFQ